MFDVCLSHKLYINSMNMNELIIDYRNASAAISTLMFFPHTSFTFCGTFVFVRSAGFLSEPEKNYENTFTSLIFPFDREHFFIYKNLTDPHNHPYRHTYKSGEYIVRCYTETDSGDNSSCKYKHARLPRRACSQFQGHTEKFLGGSLTSSKTDLYDISPWL